MNAICAVNKQTWTVFDKMWMTLNLLYEQNDKFVSVDKPKNINLHAVNYIISFRSKIVTFKMGTVNMES